MSQDLILAPASPDVSRGTAWAAALLLSMLAMISYLDRLILSLLIGGIKAEFAVSDTQLGLLVGASFAAFYVAFAIPMSRLADRWNRRWLILIAATMWNGLTAASAFAPNFTTLVLLRIGVALGEAALMPAAMSILGDLFDRRSRTRPIAIFVGAGSIGASGSLVFGAAIVQLASRPAISQLFGLGALNAWRLTLLTLGLGGLVFVALFALFSREPLRLAHPEKHPKAGQITSEFARHAGAYAAVILTPCLIGVAGMAMLTWYPTYLVRQFGTDIAQAGYAFGLVGLIGTPFAVVIGPALMHWIDWRGRNDGYAWVIVAASLGLIPLMIASMAATSLAGSLAFAAPAYLLVMIASNLATVVMPLLAPPAIRGQAMAVYMFIGVLVSLGLGPYIVAFVSDRIFPGNAGLGQAMTAITSIVAPLLVLAQLLLRRRFASAMHSAAVGEQAAGSAQVGKKP